MPATPLSMNEQNVPPQVAQSAQKTRRRHLGNFRKTQLCCSQAADCCTKGHECDWAHGSPSEESQIDELGDHTTVVILNIPRGTTEDIMKKVLDNTGFMDCYNLVKLPRSGRRKARRQFLFVNFTSVSIAQKFHAMFHLKRFPHSESDLLLRIHPAHQQWSECNSEPHDQRRSRRHWKDGEVAHVDRCTLAGKNIESDRRVRSPSGQSSRSSTSNEVQEPRKIELAMHIEPPPTPANSSSRSSGHGDAPTTKSLMTRSIALQPGNFRKTQLCRFWTADCCVKGHECDWAHSEAELRNLPDLTKTLLCRSRKRKECPLTSEECPFAHGREEIGIRMARLKKCLTRPALQGSTPLPQRQQNVQGPKGNSNSIPDGVTKESKVLPEKMVGLIGVAPVPQRQQDVQGPKGNSNSIPDGATKESKVLPEQMVGLIGVARGPVPNTLCTEASTPFTPVIMIDPGFLHSLLVKSMPDHYED